MTKDEMQTLRDLVATHKTIRYGILSPSVHQTVENHVNRMLILAPVVARMVGLKYETNKLNALILVHDLPELGMEKDITILEQIDVEGAKRLKDELEAKNILNLADKYGQWIKDLFDEYEKQESEPARFVKWLDKYEASRHMLEIHAYTQMHLQENSDYVSFFANTGRLIDATKRLPVLMDFTMKHVNEELAAAFARDNRQDKFEQLIERIKKI